MQCDDGLTSVWVSSVFVYPMAGLVALVLSQWFKYRPCHLASVAVDVFSFLAVSPACLCAGLVHSDGSAEAVSPLLSALAVRLPRMTNSACSCLCVAIFNQFSCKCSVRYLFFV